MSALELVRFAGSLLLVLGLIALLAWGLRRWGHLVPGLVTPGPARGSAARLSVVESLSIDPRRRLVIVRRDDTEHLLLLAPESHSVIETGIRREPA